MIELEFRNSRIDKAWQTFHTMPASLRTLETYKLLFKHIKPVQGFFSNKVKTSGIEEHKT